MPEVPIFELWLETSKVHLKEECSRPLLGREPETLLCEREGLTGSEARMLNNRDFALHVEECVFEWRQLESTDDNLHANNLDSFLLVMWPEDAVIPNGITRDEWRDVLHAAYSKIGGEK